MFQKERDLPLARHGLIVVLLLSMLLLGACSGLNGSKVGATSTLTSTTATPMATPTISLGLQDEGNAELQSFQQWITLMQQSQGNVATYQQQYNSDKQALSQATSVTDYQKALQTVKGHVQDIQIPAMKQESVYLQQKLAQEVNAWNKQHSFYDSYNSTTYSQGYEYDNSNGIGGSLWLGNEFAADKTTADYQQTVEDLHMWLTNFQAMKDNMNDKTAYDQTHQTDLTLLKHYGDMKGHVIVVSLGEQALRAYADGKLVKAFQVTTGQPSLPTPPGTWWIEGKQHPTTFKSLEPKGSPDWYPPTKINYAMQYHSNGYFFHDAWWRTQFGPGTNYPHQDPNGDPFAGQGSHGCVNMSTDNAQWMYGFVSVYTNVIIY